MDSFTFPLRCNYTNKTRDAAVLTLCYFFNRRLQFYSPFETQSHFIDSKVIKSTLLFTVKAVLYDLHINRICFIQHANKHPYPKSFITQALLIQLFYFFYRQLRFSFFMTTQIKIFLRIYSAHKNTFRAPNFSRRPTSYAVFHGRLQIVQNIPYAALDGATHSLRFIRSTAFY